MNRRNFLQYLQVGIIGTTVLPIVKSQLFANNYKLNQSYSQNIDINLMSSDVYLPKEQINTFLSVRNKLSLIQRHVGYGNFNILSFDEAVDISRRGRGLEPFSKEEFNFIESIYHYDPTVHGFFGQRTSHDLTSVISKRDVVKISGTGHYLFKGKTVETYNHMKNDIGNTIILTSGVRSIVKQLKLYLDKVNSTNGNLSEASKAIAPPGFSYHTIGDFDVGKKGFGYSNFTPRFALTNEFFKMRKLKYIDMRYTINNKDGVRYEPWHIKIV